eukprot:Rhum_TRINITY_DN14423_c6_g1::Rhum_TRINITY_DN14423_c6_g1_i1::g.88962::m.88962
MEAAAASSSNDQLLCCLGALRMHAASMQRSHAELARNLDKFDADTSGLARKAGVLSQRMRGLDSQLENVRATRDTVLKVSDKFDDITKAKALIAKGADLDVAELIDAVDSLREAARYAHSLNRANDAASEKRLSEQTALLDRAAVLLDNRLRSVITTQMKPVEYRDYQAAVREAEAAGAAVALPPFMEAAEQEHVTHIVLRMQGTEPLREFAAALRKALRQSIATCGVLRAGGSGGGGSGGGGGGGGG